MGVTAPVILEALGYNEDLLVDILRRLGARSLAACRGVCKAWAATVDAGGLLRPDLLPRSLAGIFINFNDLRYSEFFSRPALSSSTSTGAPCDKLGVYGAVQDHCNGLLLLYSSVANPATGWSAPLPPRPPPGIGRMYFPDDAYLTYDPTELPADHYQVFLIPRVPYIELDVEPDKVEVELVDPAMMGLEWPPSPFVLRVFSSATGRWEEKTFLREGEAAGTVADMTTDISWKWRHAVCWRGALYVHCQNCFVMRISLSNDTYQVIRLPGDVDLETSPELQLGRSENGVYCAYLSAPYRLRVWILNESSSHKYEWVLKHDKDHLELLLPCLNHGPQGHGPWILQDANYNEEKYYLELDDDNIDTTIVDQEKYEWNSDDDGDNVLDTGDMVDNCDRGSCISILGFHPSKEIVFLSRALSRGLAYHLNTSKFQDLGNLCSKYYSIASTLGLIAASFPYTPCLMPLMSVTPKHPDMHQLFSDETEEDDSWFKRKPLTMKTTYYEESDPEL